MSNRELRDQDWKDCWERGEQRIAVGRFSHASPVWHRLMEGRAVCRPTARVKVVEEVAEASLWYSAPQARKHYTSHSPFENLCKECFARPEPEPAQEMTPGSDQRFVHYWSGTERPSRRTLNRERMNRRVCPDCMMVLPWGRSECGECA